MLASRPLVAASVILPSILLLGYLWQKRREEDSAASTEEDSSQQATSTIPVDSKQVSAKLESLTRFRLDCIEEERCEESVDIKSTEVNVVCEKLSSSSDKVTEELTPTKSSKSEVVVQPPDLVCDQQIVEEVSEELVANNSFAEAVAIISEVFDKQTVQFRENSKVITEVKTMTTEESVEVSSSEQIAIPNALAALKDPIVSPVSISPPPTSEDGKAVSDNATDDNLSSPVKSEISQKSESTSWSDLIEADEELELEECRLNSPKKIAAAIPGTEEHGRNDSGVASPTEDFSRPETVATSEDKARNSSGEDAGIGGSETDEVSDGNADLTNEDSQMFSYHFYIQDYLTGQFIGTKGTAINNLKTTCGCNVIVRDETSLLNQRRRSKLKVGDRRYGDGNMNLVMLEGTRRSIDKCLDTIKERFLRYPELTLEQMNKPENTSLSLNAGSVALSLVEGIMHDVVISSIVYGDHIFIQQPTNPTFSALERLDVCMKNTYSELSCPTLSRPIIANSICVAPSNGGWYRCQVVSFDESDDTCNIKYVDYGGYDIIPAQQLKQIRTDFLSLPFQAIECHLANILIPDGDTVSSTILEELVNGQAIQARMLGVDADNLPMIHIYRNCNGQTVMVNRELVDRNCAEWIESKFVALPEMAAEQNWNILGDFSPSNDICEYRMMQVKYFTNLGSNYSSTFDDDVAMPLILPPSQMSCSPRELTTTRTTYTCDDVFQPLLPLIMSPPPNADANVFLSDLPVIRSPIFSPYYGFQVTDTCTGSFQQVTDTCTTANHRVLQESNYPLSHLTNTGSQAAVQGKDSNMTCCQGLPELALSPAPCSLISDGCADDDDWDLLRPVSESPAPVM